MIEVCQNLFVGSEYDEQQIRNQPGWFFIHACKEPYHRQALGYTGRAAPKTHPEYLMAKRGNYLILNLVDANDASYISREIIDAALEFIHSNIKERKVLLHCNQGCSRSPGIAILYLLRHTDAFRGHDMEAAILLFREIYPPYNPAQGIADYVRTNWHSYKPTE